MPSPLCKTSIALCTYNGEKYLEEQLNSYLQNSILPDELIVCDDRSTDGTITIVNDFAKRAPFEVKIVINESNLGSSKNFEKAILLTKGDVVFLSDQDDVWHASKVESILAAFEGRKDIGLVFSNAQLVDAELRDLGSRLWATLFTRQLSNEAFRKRGIAALLFDGNYITGATLAIRSTIRDMIRLHPVPSGYVHDHWLSILAFSGWGVAEIDQDLIMYRQHEGQQIGAMSRRKTPSVYAGESRSIRFNHIIQASEQQLTAFRLLLDYVGTTLAFPVNDDDRSRKVSVLLKSKVEDLENQIDHFRTRRDLKASRWRRIPQIFRELWSGRYSEFSTGIMSAGKDLLH